MMGKPKIIKLEPLPVLQVGVLIGCCLGWNIGEAMGANEESGARCSVESIGVNA